MSHDANLSKPPALPIAQPAVPPRVPHPVNVLIHASDLAACIGLNPYRSRQDALSDYFSRHFAAQGAPVPMTKRKRVEETFEALQHVDPATHAACKAVLDTAVLATAKDVAAVAEHATEILKKSAADLSDSARLQLEEYVRSAVNTRFGTEKEDGVREALPDHTTKTDKYIKRLAFRLDGVNVFVGGRCDGVAVDHNTGEQYVVEIKNRVRKLFNRVVDYERVQLLTYLFVHGIPRGRLVEQFGARSRTYDVLFDPVEWEGIAERLRAFVVDLVAFAGRQNAAGAT
jgi:hypothetical protein